MKKIKIVIMRNGMIKDSDNNPRINFCCKKYKHYKCKKKVI